MKTAAPIVALSARFNEADDENVRADLAALPGLLRAGRRLDRRRRARRRASSNAADFQIAPSVAPADDPRRPPRRRSRTGPPGELALRVVPDFPGDAPPIFPPAWLEPLRSLAAGASLNRPVRTIGADRLDPLARRRARRRRVAEPGPVGQRQLGVELEQRHEHEAARASPRGAAASAARSRARGRRAAAGRRRAGAGCGGGRRSRGPRSASIALQSVEQLLAARARCDPDRGVEEVGLVEDLADRLGLVGRGDRLDLDPALARGRRSRRAGGRRGRRRSSRARGSPGSRRVPGLVLFLVELGASRSRTTSTATSSIASGSGGSGLAARTRTDSQPKRSISRSPITSQRRSSVR